MKKLKIITIPALSLRKKSIPIDKITPEIQELSRKMVDVLHSKPGLGLAAPQVGYNIRLIIIESRETRDEEGNILYENIPLMTLVNPVITHFSKDRVVLDEGCFSVPDQYGPIERPVKIRAEALDINGNKVKINTKGLLARVIQHEIDHLDGILFVDRLKDPKDIRTIEADQDIQA
jgi:peptide deformylase